MPRKGLYTKSWFLRNRINNNFQTITNKNVFATELIKAEKYYKYKVFASEHPHTVTCSLFTHMRMKIDSNLVLATHLGSLIVFNRLDIAFRTCVRKINHFLLYLLPTAGVATA